jgi:hypothetical protein
MADTATGQHGAITVEQIGTAGMSPDQLRRRVQSGILDQILPHTFRSPFSATSARADLAALVLDCGPESFASGPTAAALHRLDGFVLKAPFHVTVLRGRNVQRAHHVVHTTTELPLVDRTTVEGIAAMSATRTMIDVARFVRPDRLTAALDAALRDGLTSEEALHQRITQLRSSGRYGIPRLLAVIEGSEITRGGHSWLERRFLELCGRAMLPRPATQQVLTRTGDRLVRVDCRFPGRCGRRVARLPLAPDEGADVTGRGTSERTHPGRVAPDPVHLRPGHVGSRRHDRHRPPHPRRRLIDLIDPRTAVCVTEIGEVRRNR